MNTETKHTPMNPTQAIEALTDMDKQMVHAKRRVFREIADVIRGLVGQPQGMRLTRVETLAGQPVACYKEERPTRTSDMPSVKDIQFIGEEASDWAAKMPHIGPANNARVKTVLVAGHWLQNNASLVVSAPDMAKEIAQLKAERKELVTVLTQVMERFDAYREKGLSFPLTETKAKDLIVKHSKV